MPAHWDEPSTPRANALFGQKTVLFRAPPSPAFAHVGPFPRQVGGTATTDKRRMLYTPHEAQVSGWLRGLKALPFDGHKEARLADRSGSRAW